MVWPYGSYNDELLQMAGESGMSIALTLDDGANTPDVPLTALQRTLIEHNPALAEFALEVRGPRYPEPVRVVQVNLDDVYSADAARQERNLSKLLDRIEVLKPTHVYLQATTDTDGDGVADAAYFPNRHLPLRGNLFNRAAWQLASRVDVKVYAVLPVTAFRLPQNNIAEVYEDLARYNNFDGLVFDDGLRPGELQDVDTLEFTRRLAARARAARAPLKTVRTTTSVQMLPALAAEYDFVALVGNDGPLSVDPEVRRKVVFMLQNNQATVACSPGGCAHCSLAVCSISVTARTIFCTTTRRSPGSRRRCRCACIRWCRRTRKNDPGSRHLAGRVLLGLLLLLPAVHGLPVDDGRGVLLLPLRTAAEELP
jgi:hypothetical protein